MSAYKELMRFLVDGEIVESIVFGPWGWGSAPSKEDNQWTLGYGEPEDTPVPFDKRGLPMSLDEARPMMQSWKFARGYGAPSCYAVYIWTNQRVIWVTQYGGSTRLNSAPRNPRAIMPEMPGS